MIFYIICDFLLQGCADCSGSTTNVYVDYEGSNQVHLSVSGAARYIILRISSKSLLFILIFRNGGWSGGASGTTSGGYNGATPVSF